MNLNWDITMICNLNCKHCGVNSDSLYEQNNSFDWDKFKRNIDGFDNINIIGGEPMLVSEIHEIVKYLKNREKGVSLVTNGQFKNSDYLKLVDSGIDSIAFSLEGNQAENDYIRGEGTYINVINNISDILQYLKENEYSTTIRINITLTKKNASTIFSTLDVLFKLFKGPKFRVKINNLTLTGNAIDNKEELFISDLDKLKIFEKIAKYILLTGNAVEVDLQYPFIAEYLNLITDSKFESLENQCSTVIESMYMDPSLNVSPCKKLIKNSINDYSLEKLSDLSDVFSMVMNQKSRGECYECKYVEMCKPCPLENEDCMPEICKIAMNIIFDIDFSKRTYRREKLIISQDGDNGTKIYFPKLNMITEYTNIGFQLIHFLETEKSVDEIAGQFSLTKEDVLGFIYEEMVHDRIIQKIQEV